MPSQSSTASDAKTSVCRLIVFGASGPTGLQVVRQALAAGLHVTAVTRTPPDYPIAAPLLRVVAADVLDSNAVGRAIEGGDAVISTFGVPYSRREVTVYSRGADNIVRAMTDQLIERIVCVSSTGVSKREVPGETLFWRKILFPFFRRVLGRTVYADMRRMEGIVRGSGLIWTIVRPAGLFDADLPTSDYRVGPGRLHGRLTSRADLAQTLIREAVQARHTREIIEVTTSAGLPSNFSILRGIAKQPSRK